MLPAGQQWCELLFGSLFLSIRPAGWLGGWLGG